MATAPLLTVPDYFFLVDWSPLGVPTRDPWILGLPAALLLNLGVLNSARLQVDLNKFVRRKGAGLTLGGQPFYFAGFNNYYMMTRAADTGPRKEVRRV